MLADQAVHDGCGAGQRADGNVDRPLGFQAADQLVVVDDRGHIQRVDIGGQFGRVVGIHNHGGGAVGNVGHDARLGAIPVFENEGCLCIRLSQQHGLCRGFLYFVQEPRPDNG